MREERDHFRNQTFSVWRRCIGGTHCIDIDFMEYCGNCNRILALLELCEQRTQKSCSMIKRTANSIVQGNQKGVPAYVVYYTSKCDSDGCWIVSAEIDQVAPIEKELGRHDEKELAEWLAHIHTQCECDNPPEITFDYGCSWYPRKGMRNIINRFPSVFIGIGGTMLNWLKRADDKFQDQLK